MKILLLGGDGRSTDVVYNALKSQYQDVFAVVEDSVSNYVLLKRRIKKLGLFTVGGQVLFQLFIVKKLKKQSEDRIQEILSVSGLSDSKKYRESNAFCHVDSVNDDIVFEIYDKIKPDVVIVNGTRIIGKKLIAHVEVPMINMHAGITPKYRGVHGAYWAYYNNDGLNAGVTVHLIDEGIDTGGVLYQKAIEVSEADNFVTYPYLQLVEGIQLEYLAINDAAEDRLKIVDNNLESFLWSHPTLWQYMAGKKRGIR